MYQIYFDLCFVSDFLYLYLLMCYALMCYGIGHPVLSQSHKLLSKPKLKVLVRPGHSTTLLENDAVFIQCISAVTAHCQSRICLRPLH